MAHSISGFGYLASGIRLLAQPGIKRFVVVPVLINILVFSGMIYLGAQQFTHFMDWILPPDVWYSVIRPILWPLFAIAAVLIGFFTFSMVANMIASPFNSLLAQRVEEHLTGEKLNAKGQALSMMASIRNEIRKITYALSRAIPILILFLIPVVNVAAPVIWFLFGAWMMTIQYADFTMANHHLAFDEQRRRLKTRKLASFGFGAAVTLMTLVPILNFFAMPSAVAGASKMWVEVLRHSE